MKPNLNIIRLVIIIVLLALMLSACNVSTAIPTPAAEATLPGLTQVVASPTATGAAPAQTPAGSAGQSETPATVDVSAVAQDIASLVVAAVPPGADRMWWTVMPQHTLLWLYGYPIAGHVKQPQIFIYPVEDLGVNEAAGKAAESLQTLLQDQQVGQSLPFLPLSGDLQALHAQVQFLDFKNGKGVRFLTQLANGMAPVNNHALFYTYQGLTSDGQYYVAAVLPVSLPGLPTYPTDTDNLPLEFTSDYPTYVGSMVNRLNLQPASDYTPDLSKLDAMVQSIEIK